MAKLQDLIQINQELQKQVNISEKIKESFQNQMKSLQVSLDIEKQRAKILTDSYDKLDSTIFIKEREVEIDKIKQAMLEEEIKKRYEHLETLEKIVEKTEAEKNDIIALREETDEYAKQQLEIIENEDKRIKKQEELIELQKESKAAIDGVQDSTKSVVKSLTGIGDSWKNTLFGKIILSSRTAGGLGSAFKEMGKGLKSAFSLTNILASGFMKVQEATVFMMIHNDEAVSSFNKMTGAAGAYDEKIIELSKRNRHLGIDTKDSAMAFAALRGNMLEFNNVSDASQANLGDFVSRMNRIGVSIEQSSESMQFSTKTLGMTADQAIDAQMRIMATTDALGIAPARMAKEFSNASPRLAAFGKGMTQQFQKLLTVVKATGMESGRILDITDKFDTFEGASEAVGKLNSVLGGDYLDTMQMMQVTDPTERLKMMKDAVLNAGHSFDTMTYYEKKAIAAQMNLKDVDELGRVLNGNAEQYSDATQKNAMRQEKLNEIIDKTLSIGEKLAALFKSFGEFFNTSSIVSFFKDAVTWVTKLNMSMTGWQKTLAIVAGIGGLLLLKKSVSGLFNLFGGLIKRIPVVGGLLSKVGGSDKEKGMCGCVGNSVSEAIKSAPEGVMGKSKGLLGKALEGTKSVGKSALGMGRGAMGALGGFGKSALGFLGRSAGAATLGTAGAVVGAGVAGVMIGRYLDKTFGISEKISDLAYNNKMTKTQLSDYEKNIQKKNAEEKAARLADFAARGIKVRTAEEEQKQVTVKKENLDKESKKVTEQVTKKKEAEHEAAAAVNEPLVQQLKETTDIVTRTTETKITGNTKETLHTVVLEIGGRKMDEYILDVMNNKMNPNRL